MLCLQNYCAFRWVFSKTVPVKINGDDILFRCTRGEYDRWAAFVGSVGLRLSVGKTLVDSRQFSINSSFFRSVRGHAPSLIPVLRTGGLVKPVESLSGLGGALRRFCRGYVGEQLIVAKTLFLRWRGKEIRRSGRSVVRGLGIPACVESLHRAGLWRRECWYAELPSENGLPEDPSRMNWAAVPPGWSRVACSPRTRGERRRLRELQSAFVREMVHAAWQGCASRGTLVRAYFAQVRSSGYERFYREWLSKRKVPRRGLYSLLGTLRIRPPTTFGASTVRRWIEDGITRWRAPLGLGAGVKGMVWLPDEEAVELCSWEPSVLMWDPPAYQRFLLGGAVVSAP